MEEKIAKHLNWFYYGSYALAVLVATLLWYLVTREKIQGFDPQTTIGYVLQSIAIFYTLISVPGALYVFKRKCNIIRQLPDESKYPTYYHWAVARICVIGFGITIDIAAFYLLLGYQSMLWCAAVSAVALFFCKPNARKVQLELSNEQSKDNY